MKILIVNTYYYPNMIGGTEQSVKLLAEGLFKKGHDVFILTGDKYDKEYEEINGVKIIRLDLKNRNNSKMGKVLRKSLEFNNLRIKNKLTNIIKELKPNVIHTNNLFYISPAIWKIANDNNIKVVHTLRDYWGVCPKATLLNRNSEICNNERLLCKIHNKNYEFFSKYVDVVTAPSEFTLELYFRKGLFRNIERVKIANAIEIDKNNYYRIIKDRKACVNERIKFLFMGSLDKHKGIDYLIETFKSIDNDNLSLTICGDGPLKLFVEEACRDDKRINFLGSVFNEQKDRVLRESDVMIIPSIWYEPFGRVVIEAYKHGLAVIAFEIGGIKELLDEKCSIGVSVKNKKELRDAMINLSDRSTLKNYFTDSERLLSLYDLEDQLKKFESIYI